MDNAATQPVVITDTSKSPNAKLRPTPVTAVRLTDCLLAPRIERNLTVTIPSQFDQCESTGRIDNFRRAAGLKDGPFQGIYFNDSDVYKWLEAASYALASHPGDTRLNAMVSSAIDTVAAAQDPNGYLNTYFSVDRVDARWTNLKDMHELYCAGHLFQAAVAHYRATGTRKLLDVAIRFADHICETFGPDARLGACGHEEIEMALVELYRATGNGRYLHQARFFIDQRGSKPTTVGSGTSYHQDHAPYRELGEVVGHAVRMMYLASGAADVAAETDTGGYRPAMERQWKNMTQRRMYVTGGLGARWEGEAFGLDYELPNDRAYTETCAAIGSLYWNWRLLSLTGDAKYADLFEHTLYNAVLPGLSLDGREYFYQNPLADDGHHRRQEWFGCACCPPNIARLLASLTGYFYSVADNAVWVHLYASGEAELELPGGDAIHLRQETDYPWDGLVTIVVDSAPESGVTLHLRIPEWAVGATLKVNGEALPQPVTGDYAAVRRCWRAGDKIEIGLPLAVRRIVAHPYVDAARGSAARIRGPILYAVEQADHAMDVRDIRLPRADLSAVHRPELLGGVTVLEGQAVCENASAWEGKLYRESGAAADAGATGTRIIAIPYFTWANRESGPMRVLIPEEENG